VLVDPSWVSTVPSSGGYDDTNAADLGKVITTELLKQSAELTGLVALNDMYASAGRAGRLQPRAGIG
jgi:hypothetical protein